MSKHTLNKISNWLKQQAPLVSSQIRLFQHDSREVGKGDVFFAIQGAKVDGHAYLQEVASKGACAAVVSNDYEGEDYGMVLFRVEDVLAALHALAKSAFAEHPARVVAITGSVGKTTTKEFLATLLSGKFRTAKTPGNSNSQVSLPLTVLNWEGDDEIFVVEMGMTGYGEIERLVQITPPDIALITKIALGHAAYFPEGMPAIAEAKSEIFSHPKTQKGFIHVQATEFSPMQKGLSEKMAFGWENEEGEKEYALRLQDGQYQIIEKGKPSPFFSLPFHASHLCENFLGAVAVARHFGMSWEEIFAQAAHLKVYKQRFELLERNGITFLNDSYNANPTSMKAALNNLPKPQTGGKTIAILGEMRELGHFAEQSHREIGEIALHCIDHMLCLGPVCQPIVDRFHAANRPAELFFDLKEAKGRVFALAKPGDVVLIKGSNSLQLWKVLE